MPAKTRFWPKRGTDPSRARATGSYAAGSLLGLESNASPIPNGQAFMSATEVNEEKLLRRKWVMPLVDSIVVTRLSHAIF